MSETYPTSGWKIMEAVRGRLMVKPEIVPDIPGSWLIAVEAVRGNTGDRDMPSSAVKMNITGNELNKIMEVMLMNTRTVEANIILTSCIFLERNSEDHIPKAMKNQKDETESEPSFTGILKAVR